MGTKFIVSMGLGTHIFCHVKTTSVDISTVETNILNKIHKEMGLLQF